MHTTTPRLALRKRGIGTMFPSRLTNTWGEEINRELDVLDAAIGAFCTEEQIDNIRRAIKSHAREGIIL